MVLIGLFDLVNGEILVLGIEPVHQSSQLKVMNLNSKGAYNEL